MRYSSGLSRFCVVFDIPGLLTPSILCEFAVFLFLDLVEARLDSDHIRMGRAGCLSTHAVRGEAKMFPILCTMPASGNGICPSLLSM